MGLDQHCHFIGHQQRPQLFLVAWTQASDNEASVELGVCVVSTAHLQWLTLSPTKTEGCGHSAIDLFQLRTTKKGDTKDDVTPRSPKSMV